MKIHPAAWYILAAWVLKPILWSCVVGSCLGPEGEVGRVFGGTFGLLLECVDNCQKHIVVQISFDFPHCHNGSETP